ncbi:hypothetical protein RQP46_007115 [Phenoliferia psychrophenolica]
MSSWKIGKTAATAPLPASDVGPPISRSGLLTIRLVEAKNLSLPQGTVLPSGIQAALANGQKEAAEGAVQGKNRDSLQRKQMWWLPYVVMEFDKNEVLIDALGGDLASPVWMFRAHFDVSRVSDVSISAYLRTSPIVPGQNRNDMGNDLFLGGIKFTPVFDANQPSDQWFAAAGGATSTGGTGQFHLQVSFKPASNAPMTIDAFDLLKVIGKGSFGKVMQVRKKDTGRIYALKTIRKAHIVSRSEVTHTLAERTVLAQVNNPFIVPLKFSFQNAEKLYLVLAFINGGELFHHLQREGRFNEERSRFYAAELLCALEHLHQFNVIYRDLKPENILIDFRGHIALCDFGLCKLNMTESETTNTFCGTPEYLAPELLLGHGYQKTVDWWTLGVLLYEMLSGLPPFYSENTNEMYQKILTDPLKFPDEIAPDARSLLTGLLTRDPALRLGVNGAESIKQHPFFSKHIDFKLLMAKKIQPPFKPSVESAADTSNFDTEFTSEAPQDSVVEDSHLSETVQAQFQGFSYVQPSGGFGESADTFLKKVDQLDETLELIQDAKEGMDEIKWRREELTGSQYTAVIGRGDPNFKSRPHPTSASAPLDDHEIMYLATLITTNSTMLVNAYKGTRLIKHRFNTIVKKPATDLSVVELEQLKREVKLINQSYADRLEEVGDLVLDEEDDVERGTCDQRTVRWIREHHPDWEDLQVLKALTKAKATFSARTRTNLATMDILQNPFTEIDRTVRKLQLYQTGIASSDFHGKRKAPSATPAPGQVTAVYGALAGVFSRFRKQPQTTLTTPRRRVSFWTTRVNNIYVPLIIFFWSVRLHFGPESR